MDELSGITGTGVGGRVRKQDILAYVEDRKSGKVSAPTMSEPVLRFEVASRSGQKTLSEAVVGKDGKLVGRSSTVLGVNQKTGEQDTYEYRWIATRY